MSDPHRRRVLDLLRQRDGQTLSDLETQFPEFTRFGLMKHLKILEDASLIATRKSGRFKYHYLNPIPLQDIADRWISSFAAPWARGLSQLKWDLEEGNEPMTAKPKHMFTTIIRTAPEALWDALVNPEKTQLYFPYRPVRTGGRAGTPYDRLALDGTAVIKGEVLEANPFTRLVITFAAQWDASVRNDPPSRVTYEIEQQAECCKLTVVHDEFEGETQTYRLVGDGWPATLSGLKTLLETGKPLQYDPMAPQG
ncbi:MAG: SRPBCC domain-containing protein [Rhodomicrobium sp.]